MTPLLQRRGVTSSWLLAMAIFCCVAFGVASGVDPKYAIVGLAGVGFVVIVFLDLTVGIAIFAALSYLDALGTGGAALSFNKVLGLLLIVSWLLRRATTQRADPRTVISQNPRLFMWIVAFLGWSLISSVWAVESSVAFSYVYRDILEMLVVPVVYSAVNSRRDVYLIVCGLLVGALISSIYGIAHPTAAGTAYAGRFTGTTGDPNAQAAALAAAVGRAARQSVVAMRSVKLRTIAIVTVVLSLVGIVETLSRSGLVALGVMMLSAVAFGGQWRRKATLLVVLGMIGVAGYYAVLAPAAATKRVTDVNSDGRNDIWLVAWRMFAANPVLGVGAGNFQNASNRYLERPGLVTAAPFIIDTPKVAHNIYLENLATLGVPGLILMCALFVGVIAAALRAARIFERLGDRELDLVSRSCILALVAFLVSDFFISGFQTKQFWLIFGLSLAMLKLARTEARSLSIV
jgi:O-antigen ligase